MVHGYHAISSAYGFWLPNDPRSSWSDFVGSWELFRYGNATKTNERRSVAHDEHNRQQRLAAKEALNHPAVLFTDAQIQGIGDGFARSASKGKVTVWACAILRDHFHLVIARHGVTIEKIVDCFKGEATKALLDQQLHPFADERDERDRPVSCWTRGRWKVFLDTVEDIQRAIEYVEQNPIKEGMPPQKWGFVTPFEGI